MTWLVRLGAVALAVPVLVLTALDQRVPFVGTIVALVVLAVAGMCATFIAPAVSSSAPLDGEALVVDHFAQVKPLVRARSTYSSIWDDDTSAIDAVPSE